MYITKIELNKNNDIVKEILRDVNKLHKFVWKFFEDMTDFCVTRESISLLYRIMVNGDKIFLIMQSKVKPNNPISEDMGTEIYCVTDEIMKKRLQSINNVRFNILVNPVMEIEKRKRVYIKNRADRFAWFKNYASKNGFEVVDITELSSESVTGRKGNMTISYGASEMMGVLKITDFDKFYALVERGMGREKAYGLGLFIFG